MPMTIPGALPISAPDAQPPPPERATGSGASFGAMLDVARGAPPPVRSAQPALGIDPILFAEIDRIAQDERDRRARARATELMRALGAVQRALLAPGCAPKLPRSCAADPSMRGSSDPLHHLARLLAEPAAAAQDPALAAIVASIRLRAQIELARADLEAS